MLIQSLSNFYYVLEIDFGFLFKLKKTSRNVCNWVEENEFLLKRYYTLNLFINYFINNNYIVIFLCTQMTFKRILCIFLLLVTMLCHF